jgi:2-succinyl-5-enolpyruvyl-6-hydroxy-3-cyclohexene-1-carboxylate synthase
MTAPNRNALWGEVFVDELARSGLRAVCIAPGSRSTPLTMAFARDPRLTVTSLVDERGAAFFALGLALAGQAPVALVCTSGTAAANFYPAVVEANQAGVPLLVLTADRPPELRHSGANQTIDQVKLYGDHVRWFVDVALPEPRPSANTLRYLRTLANRAVAMAAGSPMGPVHLNFPFRKPLEPVPVPDDTVDHIQTGAAEALTGRADGRPFVHVSRGVLAPSEEQIDSLVAAVQAAPRGLIVCGPRCPGRDFPQTVARLARLTGYPVLADGLSGVRFGPQVEEARGLILGGYESFLPGLMNTAIRAPQLVLRFGAMPTGKATGEYLELPGHGRQIGFEESGRWADAGYQLDDYLWADPELSCRRLVERLQQAELRAGDEDWAATFRHAERVVWTVTEAAFAEQYSEGAVLPDLVELLPTRARLFVASSLPVRHLEQFVPPNSTPIRTLANRGASGIDGTVSSALGAAAASEAPLVLVSGDLAFYHDLNGLLALRRCGLKLTIVLLNNDGGGIFRRLPIADFDPPFTDLFLTPHGLDFEPLVRAFGADFMRATSRGELRRALQAALEAETTHVIEVSSDSAAFERQRREIIAKISYQLSVISGQ